MKNFNIGIIGTAEAEASEELLAVNVGSGSLEVFATPMMIMLMEKAACTCLGEFLENDETTVGTHISVNHASATPRGMKITAKAEVTEINGREIVFRVSACDEVGPIGEGVHKRFVVYAEKFMSKTNSKKAIG